MNRQARQSGSLDQHIQPLFRHETTGKSEIAADCGIDGVGRGGDGTFVDADPVDRDGRVAMQPVAAEVGQHDETTDMVIEVSPLCHSMAQREGGAFGQAVPAIALERVMRPLIGTAVADCRAVMMGGDRASDTEIIAAMDHRHPGARAEREQPGGEQRIEFMAMHDIRPVRLQPRRELPQRGDGVEAMGKGRDLS